MATIVVNKIGKVVNLLIDGNVFQKTFEEKEHADNFFKLALNAKNGGQKELDELYADLNRLYRTVVHGILETDKTEKYYLKGFNYPIPQILLETFLEYLDKGFPTEALVNFWKLLMLNPDTKIRESLFDFLNEYKFAITDNGYFIGYKVVQILINEVNEELAAFVQEKYSKIKSNKKSPKNYTVIKDTTKNKFLVMNAVLTDEDDVDLNEGLEIVGNLAELFENLEKTNGQTIYTDRWNQTTRVILGQKVSKERKFEPHTVECSDNGLHVGSTGYINRFYNPGNTVLMVLVNPAHVIHVPKSETSKIRTAEYYPYALLKMKETPTTDGNKFDVVEQPYFETDYSAYEKEQVEQDLAIIIEKEENGEKPTQITQDYKKILESRLVDLNAILLA